MLQIQKLEIQNFSAQNWEKAIDFRKRYFRQTFLNELEPSFEHWQKMITNYHVEHPTYRFYNVFLDEKIIAQVWHFILNVGEKEEKQFIHIQHDTDFESQELADLINEKVAEWKKQAIFSLMTTQTDFAYKIVEKNGFVKSNEKTFLSLKTENFNQKQLQEWAAFLPNNFSYSIIEKPNETECEEIAKMMTFLLNDMKRSDINQVFNLKAADIAKRYDESLLLGITYRYLLLRNEKKEAIGMSFISFKRKNPKVCKQFMTGTLTAYRRKGLAKFMKAAMYLFLQKEMPTIELVKTDCFSENDKMLNLNVKMGFETIFLEQSWYFKQKMM